VATLVGRSDGGRKYAAPRRQHALVALLVVALLSLACGARSDEPDEPPYELVLVQDIGYEPDELVSAKEQTATRHGLRPTTAAFRTGRSAGEALLKRDDPRIPGLRYRSEWESAVRAVADEEHWYGVSFYLPSDWNQGTNDDTFDDRIIFQFHEGTGGEPAFSLHLDAHSERVVLRRKEARNEFDYIWSTPLVTEQWYDVAVAAKWTREADGYFNVFLNGVPQRQYSGPTLVDGSIVYTKWGIYGQPTRILFDEVRIARGLDGLDAVSPDDSISARPQS
jgi:hypothetical protein